MTSRMASRFQLLSAAALAAALATTVNGARADLDDLVVANNALGFSLFAKLRSNAGNLFFSPYSIATCLRMVNAGARGQTHDELARLLRSSAEGSTLDGAYGDLIAALAPHTNRIELQMANGLCAQKGHRFKQDYLQGLRRDYAAELQTVDFRKAPVEAAQAVNRWAADHTQGKIPAIVDPAQFSPFDALFLANAIYFKADWQYQFPESSTAEAAFYMTNERSVPVPLMAQAGAFSLFESPSLQVLELAYVGLEFRMLVFLPRAVDGLARLEASFGEPLLARCLAGLKEEDTHVFLPGFALDCALDLKALLADVGATTMFDPATADFSGMDGTRDLFVSHAAHKAKVEVNEQGTEAVAFTHAMMTKSAAPPKYKTFRADHPFLFLIFHRTTASILFLGRVVDPPRGLHRD
jgi:serine protease inhibitor